MLGSKGHWLWRSTPRRLCAGLALAAYLLTAFGLPLPAAVPAKDRSRPFPCQDHVCGCGTAAQCLRDCCCYTPEEKSAWARARGLEAPAADQGWRTARFRDRSSETPAAADCPKCSARSKQREAPSRWRLAMSPLRCQGHGTLWITTGAVLPVPPAVTWALLLPPVGWLPRTDLAGLTLSFDLLDPPPRATACLS